MGKKLGRKPLEYEVRLCKNCTGEIPKNKGESIKRYAIKEYCCRECALESTKVELKCEYCGSYYKIGKYKSTTSNYCPKCLKKIKNGAIKCSSDECFNIFNHHSPIKWGRQQFCTPLCLIDHLRTLGVGPRYCTICGEILSSSSGCATTYLKTKTHKNCDLFKKVVNLMKKEKYNKK